MKDGGGGAIGGVEDHFDPKMKQKALESCLDAFSEELDVIRTDASFQGTPAQVDLIVDVVKGILFDALDEPLFVRDVAGAADVQMTLDQEGE